MLVYEVADLIQLERGNGASIDRASSQLTTERCPVPRGQLLLVGTGDRKVDDTGFA